jgi:hypothetical protein
VVTCEWSRPGLPAWMTPSTSSMEPTSVTYGPKRVPDRRHRLRGQRLVLVPERLAHCHGGVFRSGLPAEEASQARPEYQGWQRVPDKWRGGHYDGANGESGDRRDARALVAGDGSGCDAGRAGGMGSQATELTAAHTAAGCTHNPSCSRLSGRSPVASRTVQEMARLGGIRPGCAAFLRARRRVD